MTVLPPRHLLLKLCQNYLLDKYIKYVKKLSKKIQITVSTESNDFTLPSNFKADEDILYCKDF